MRFSIHTGNHGSHNGLSDTVTFLRCALQDCGHDARIDTELAPDRVNIVLEHFPDAAAVERIAHARAAGARFVFVATEPMASGTFNVGIAAGHAHYGNTQYWKQRYSGFVAAAAHAEAVHALERSTESLARTEADAASIEARRLAVAEELDALRTLVGRLGEEAHRHDLEAGESRHRRARIVERVRDEYDIDIDQPGDRDEQPDHHGSTDGVADDQPAVPSDRDELDREIEELRRKVATYVSVNLDALRESEELAARLATLETQLADVAEARQSIEQLIERIDEESRRLLGETIETVRTHFRELFERLFGGGQADIQLEEGVDLLETAVDIVARPPGKEPRSISLLSGGEKTMTCVALLLAIFKSRPSPFCVLDEVDAALDEANVDRFAGVLRDFLSATQFIVVTHSKKTMAAANTLYGVTMEESGVSKRVSVRFESAVAVARAA